MHSSRMRTARALTVSRRMLCSEGRGGGCLLPGGGGCLLPGGVCSWGVSAPGEVSAPGGVCSQGGVCSGWVSAPLGGVCSGGGVCSQEGVSAPGRGCLLLGGVCSGGAIPACTEADTPPPPL